MEEYNKLVKSQRLKSLIQDEPFSKCIEMDKNIRNAIAHYTYDFDSSSQKIRFFDKYRGNENVVELYLCDLAFLCYDNITILVYLNELFYNIRRIDFLENGMFPNIKFERDYRKSCVNRISFRLITLKNFNIFITKFILAIFF